MIKKNVATVDVLGFGPHPDDVEIITGGFFLKMKKLKHTTAVVDLTRGESGTRGTSETRAKEAAKAAEMMGLTTRMNLGLPDGSLQVTDDAKRKVAEVLRQLRPMLVVAPYWKDSHPDHAHASKIVTEGCFIAGLHKLDFPGEPHRPKAILYVQYHQERDFWPDFVVDISQQWDQKKKLMLCYRSQLYNPKSKERKTNISRGDFLSRIEARARMFGDLIGVEYGEGFLVRDPLRLDDPVAHYGIWDKLM